MWDTLQEFIRTQRLSGANLGWFLLLFVVMFLGSLAVAAAILVRLPADYFEGDGKPVKPRSLAFRIAKNALGVFVVLFGIALSAPGVPGQGILTILIGIMLLEFPGKRKLERRIIGRPGILKRINSLRARYGREPLRIPVAVPNVSK